MTVTFNHKLLILVTFVLFFAGNSQVLGQRALRNMVMKEQHLLHDAANTLSHEESFLKKLAATGNKISKFFEHNIIAFAELIEKHEFKISILEESIDFELEQEEMRKEEINRKENYLLEVIQKFGYQNLHDKICEKVGVNNLSKTQVISVLCGYNVLNYQISADKLYHIYFDHSNSFAKDELDKILVQSNCDSDIVKEVKEIADFRKVTLSTSFCKEDNLDFYIGCAIILIIVTAVFYSTLKKILFNFINSFKK
jgi:hypothetical protein